MILQSDSLLLRIDLDHGAEVIDLVDLRSGRQLPGRPPFASQSPRAGDLDEETWTASYRGGWQLLTPNAGSACTVAGISHGFHGRASNDPWLLLEHGAAGATLRWAGHGLTVERRFSVTDATVHADVRWEAAERSPLLAVEHLALGIELLHPEVVIELPGGRAVEMAEREGPPRAPGDVGLGHLEVVGLQQQRQLGFEGPAAAQRVERGASRDRGQPCAAPVGHAVASPGLQRPHVGILHRLLGGVEVPRHAHRRGEHVRPLATVRVGDGACDSTFGDRAQLASATSKPISGLTSTPPSTIGVSFASASA